MCKHYLYIQYILLAGIPEAPDVFLLHMLPTDQTRLPSKQGKENEKHFFFQISYQLDLNISINLMISV